jgi:hypothetical protein
MRTARAPLPAARPPCGRGVGDFFREAAVVTTCAAWWDRRPTPGIFSRIPPDAQWEELRHAALSPCESRLSDYQRTYRGNANLPRFARLMRNPDSRRLPFRIKICGIHPRPKNKKSPHSVRKYELFPSRGDRTAIELFIAGIRGWEATVRRQFDDSRFRSDCQHA